MRTELEHNWSEKVSKTKWDHGGKSRHQRGYGTAWDKLREQVMERDNRLCQPCLRKTGLPTVATQVDHIVPKARGGTNDLSNLQAICAPCHTAKTTRDAGRRPRRITGADGWPVWSTEYD